jgi:predicted phage terminase large subunit-like protein
LDDKRSDAIVIVGQRVHEDDLSGHVLARSADWTHLKLAAIEDKPTSVAFPRSGQHITREAGEPLWERREGTQQLAAMKRALGSVAYAAQYQQEPAPPEGALIKSAWWQSYRLAPPQFEAQIQSWDMAFKGEASSDYVVGQVWGRRGAENYLLDQVRGQWDIQRTIDALVALSAKWPGALLKLVEDRANGPAIINLLQGTVSGIVAVNPKDSKEARCSAVAPAIEAGNVKVPDPRYVVGAEWIEEFLLEFSRFPRGSNDDQVDAATQALGYLISQTVVTAADFGWVGPNSTSAAMGRRRERFSPFHTSDLPGGRGWSPWGASDLPEFDRPRPPVVAQAPPQSEPWTPPQRPATGVGGMRDFYRYLLLHGGGH